MQYELSACIQISFKAIYHFARELGRISANLILHNIFIDIDKCDVHILKGYTYISQEQYSRIKVFGQIFA